MFFLCWCSVSHIARSVFLHIHFRRLKRISASPLPCCPFSWQVIRYRTLSRSIGFTEGQTSSNSDIDFTRASSYRLGACRLRVV